MLHGKDDDQNDVAEYRLLKLEQALCAVFDDIHHEHEETFPKVRVKLKLILNNCKSSGTEALVDNWQLLL